MLCSVSLYFWSVFHTCDVWASALALFTETATKREQRLRQQPGVPSFSKRNGGHVTAGKQL
jgi:hypothetical protein